MQDQQANPLFSYQAPTSEDLSQLEMATFANQQEGGQPSPLMQEQQQTPSQPYAPIFEENLALKMKEDDLDRLGQEIKKRVEQDLDSRKPWEDRIISGIEQMGLGPMGKGNIKESVKDLYPTTFTHACLQLVASLMAELLPSGRLAKWVIDGEQTDHLQAQGERIADFFNYYLTRIAKEFLPDTENALFWAVPQGCYFKKVYFDEELQRPTSLAIKPQDFIVNNGATCIDSASRLTYRFTIATRDIKWRQINGLYRDIELDDQPEISEYLSDIEKRGQDLMGQPLTSDNDIPSDYRVFCETHEYLDDPSLKKFDRKTPKGLTLPYRFTFDMQTSKILGIYRNWKQNDFRFRRRKFFVGGNVFPSLGFYGLGFYHVAGGAMEAETRLLRQLLLSSILANFPAGIISQGAMGEKTSFTMAPGQFEPISGLGLTNKVGDVLQAFPYHEPSQSFFTLLGKMEEKIMGLAGSIGQPLPDFNANTPVGTMLAMTEQANRLQTSIGRRLYGALKEEYHLLYELFAETLPEQPYPFKTAGKNVILMRQDFQSNIAIVPISDPNVMSSTQALMRSETLLKTAQQAPDIHNLREAYLEFYRSLKIPDLEKILPEPQPPQPQPQSPPPIDPGQVMMQDIQMKHEYNMQKLQLEQEKLALQSQKQENEFQLKFNQLQQAFSEFQQKIALEQAKVDSKFTIDQEKLNLEAQTKIAHQDSGSNSIPISQQNDLMPGQQ